MTLSEFKAWFEGYTEGLDGAPNEKQFERIKAKVAEITGTPITQTVFVDRYRDLWPRYRETWHYPTVSYSVGSVGQNIGNAVLMNGKAEIEASFDGHAAMYEAGKHDALAS